MTLRRSMSNRVPTVLPLMPSEEREGFAILPVYNFGVCGGTTSNILQVTNFSFARNSRLYHIRAMAHYYVTATQVPENFSAYTGYMQLTDVGLSRPAISFGSPNPIGTGFLGGGGTATSNNWFNDGLYGGMVVWNIDFGAEGVPVTENGPLTLGIRLYTAVAPPVTDSMEISCEFLFKVSNA